MAKLQSLLATEEFLARVDNLNEPQERLVHISKIFQALRENPSPATGALCVALSTEPGFLAIPARLTFLLPALAAVRPMSAPAAAVFHHTSRNGYHTLNAPLLVENGSQRALAVFVEIIGDHRLDALDRVDLAHRSIVSRRTDAALLGTLRTLLDGELEPEVRNAVTESIFDDQPSRFFGRQGRQPSPPGWETVSKTARRLVTVIGQKELRRADTPAHVRKSIRDVLQRL
ncbi:MAG: hypothetical protein FJW30_17055 [Acidobacteria bacterium]|nr:hypothetical protein [Acidobacteriota bacterium]